MPESETRPPKYVTSTVTMDDGSVKIYRANLPEIAVARAIDRETADEFVEALNAKN